MSEREWKLEIGDLKWSFYGKVSKWIYSYLRIYAALKPLLFCLCLFLFERCWKEIASTSQLNSVHKKTSGERIKLPITFHFYTLSISFFLFSFSFFPLVGTSIQRYDEQNYLKVVLGNYSASTVQLCRALHSSQSERLYSTHIKYLLKWWAPGFPPC